MPPLAHAAIAFARTRWLARSLRTRADVEAWQAARIARWLARDVPHVAAYAAQHWPSLDALPVIDKRVLMADFAAYNRPAIAADRVRAALARGEARVDGHPVGQSTGTSGNRGLYVIGEAERFVWLGTILAKALPDAWRRRHRVALALPGFSTLYQSAAASGRITLGLFDLARGVDGFADELAAFAPDTIVAPPRVLRRLAESGRLAARNLFSGAETLDPIDRAVIERATGATVRELYMATEGLFGVACPLGTLHLAEDVVHFELEPVGGTGLVNPIVSDFTRRVQIMARYRMNDLIALADAPCACGSPLAAVARIEGRADDCFTLAGRDGAPRLVTPDVLRNAVVDADPGIADFRILQRAPDRIEVQIDPGLPTALDVAVRANLAALFARLEVAPPAIAITRGIEPPAERKLRRVRRDF